MDRKGVVAALETRLKDISTANGYLTDAGLNIFVWKLTPFGNNQLPGVVIRDASESYIYEDMPVNMKMCRLEIDIDIFAKSIDEVRDVASDVEKAIGVDETLSGAVEFINQIETSIEAEQHDNVIAVAGMRIEANYLSERFRR